MLHLVVAVDRADIGQEGQPRGLGSHGHRDSDLVVVELGLRVGRVISVDDGKQAVLERG